MLYLIGTGLWGWKGISIEGIQILKGAKEVYLDSYTRIFDPKQIEELENHIDNKIVLMDRKHLEEELPFLNNVKNNDIVLLVPGDPLVATTHVTIIDEANKRGIPFKVIHAASIYSSFPGEAGLQIYKMGGSVTIPDPSKNIVPYSTYEKIYNNMKLGYHTLVLLDTAPNNPLNPAKAAKILMDIEKEKGLGVATQERKIIVGCNIGSENQMIKYMRLGDISQHMFEGTCTFIFPGKLHFLEEEFLESLD